MVLRILSNYEVDFRKYKKDLYNHVDPAEILIEIGSIGYNVPSLKTMTQ